MLVSTADWLTDGRRKSRAETRAVIGYRLCWAPSASIKATANGEMLVTVACPATRRDGRRRLRLSKRKWKTSNLSLQTWVFKLQTAKVKVFKLRKWKSSNLSLQTSNCESAKVKIFKLETSKLRSQNWNLKIRKWKSSKLRAESFQLLSFDKLQVLKTEN